MRVVPHHNQVRTAQCTRTYSVGGRPILDGAMRQESNAVLSTVRSRSCRPDAVTMQPSLGHGAGEKRAASCPAPQPSPHRAVHARVFRGRSADAPRGGVRAGRAQRKSNAALSTVQSCSRRLDVVAVRLSVKQRTGEDRVASCPAPQPSPHCAVHACVFRGRSADAPRDDERAGRAPRSHGNKRGTTDDTKPQPAT